MPEGPSIVILKELVQPFRGKRIIEAGGNSKLNPEILQGQVVTDFKSWGKHFLICFNAFTIRVHLMLFGSYRVNEVRAAKPRLSLNFENGELNFYACRVDLIEADLNDAYDWEVDLMNEKWNSRKARQKLRQVPLTLVCDALLDQHIFSGCGNIIKNEVLFRIKVHPESKVGSLGLKQLNALVKEARNYSFDFLEWKRNNELSKHWLAYSKKICPRCNISFTKRSTGKTKRNTVFCNSCQVLYK